MLLTIRHASTRSLSEKSYRSTKEENEESKMMCLKTQPVCTYRPSISPKGLTPPSMMKNTVDLPGNFVSRLLSSVIVSRGGNTAKSSQPIAKGVFALQTSVMEADSRKTIDTQTTNVSSSSTSETSTTNNSSINKAAESTWMPSTADDHNKHVPIVIRRPQYDAYNETDDRKLLKMIMGKAKKLPQTSGKYASNHIMVNAERTRRNVPPLTRDRDLDRVAREHAKVMADAKMVRHMDGPSQLQAKILEGKESLADRERLFFPRLGVNIARGKSIVEIHRFMMANLAERNNVLDKRFTTMGMGTARADNGMIYLCHVFGG